MKDKEQSKRIILEHFYRYPKMRVQDLFKFLFQSAFGCEHLVSSLQRATEYLIGEYQTQKPTVSEIDTLNGDYSRVHLGIINKGLSPLTFAKLFFLSAKKEENGLTNLLLDIDICKNLIERGELPLLKGEFLGLLEEWQKSNFPAIHHSEEYRNLYKPCYRVISNEFVSLLDLFIRIDEHLKYYGGEKQFRLNNDFSLNEKNLATLNKVYENLTFSCFTDTSQKNSVLIATKKATP